MAIHDRRKRELAQRRALIVSTAREMAERDGWGAVTTRKLADSIEYSQPVLYSHFRNRDEIIQAVALQGFEELTETQRRARAEARTPVEAIRLLFRAYHRFAKENPRLYEAMFVHHIGLSFATEETPEELYGAFRELLLAVSAVAGESDPELLTEVVWASLHGLVSLDGSRRLRPEQAEARIDMLANELFGFSATRD